MMTNRLKRTALAIGAAMLLMVSVAGCWDDMALTQRALVLTVGFYPGSTPNTLKVYFSYGTPSGLSQSNPETGASGSQKQPPFTIVAGQGHSLAEAFAHAQPQANRDLYLGHTELLIFSTKLSPLMLSRLDKALNRIGSMDKTPFVAVTSEPFAKVLSATTTQSHMPGLYYEKLFICTTCSPEQTGARLWEVSTKLLSPGMDIALPYIAIEDNHPNVSRVALYRGTRFLTALTPLQTQAYALARGKGRKIALFLPDAWGASLSTIRDSAHLKVTTRGGTVHATVSMRVHATLESVDTGSANTEQISAISKRTSEVLAQRVMQFIRFTQTEDVDPLGVGRTLDWTAPTEFARYQPWPREYPNVHFTVHCQVTLEKLGDME